MTAAAYIIGSKSLDASTTALASGDLLISGYLTRWNAVDREGEKFLKGAFQKSIGAFLAGSAPLCYGHRLHDVVGKVLSLTEDTIGVKMLARVNKQPLSSPLRWVYEAVKNGSIKGLSAGAIFERIGNAIVGADLVECTISATPVLASAGFEIVSTGEGKAMAMDFFHNGAAHGRDELVTELRELARRARLELLATQVARARLRLGALAISR
jgi:HK97 family phage prohead protease